MPCTGGGSGVGKPLPRQGFSLGDSLPLRVRPPNGFRSRPQAFLVSIWGAPARFVGSPESSKVVISLQTSFKSQVFACCQCRKPSKGSWHPFCSRWAVILAPPSTPGGRHIRVAAQKNRLPNCTSVRACSGACPRALQDSILEDFPSRLATC